MIVISNIENVHIEELLLEDIHWNSMRAMGLKWDVSWMEDDNVDIGFSHYLPIRIPENCIKQTDIIIGGYQ